MNHMRIVLSVLAISMLNGLIAQTSKKTVDDEKAFIIQGDIVSVNANGNFLVIKAKILKEDTVSIDSTATIKADNKNAKLGDLKANTKVTVHYSEKNGKKIAHHIMTRKVEEPSAAVTDSSERLIISEGVISSINERGRMMVIRADIEQNDTFYIDGAAVIKAGPGPSVLKDLKTASSVEMRGRTKGGRKVATYILSIPKKTEKVKQP